MSDVRASARPPGGPPPGWYPDPAGGPGGRWWNGLQWTSDTVPTVPRFPSAAAKDIDDERRGAVWAHRAFWTIGAGAVAEAIITVAYASSLHHYWVSLRGYLDAISAGRQPPAPSLPAGYESLAGIIGLLNIGALIVVAVWQYRAATVARNLGWPAKRSPGWGVAGWFVPVINFWFPYQALRDCLPPGHGGRANVGRFWLCYVGAEVVAIGAAAAFLASGPAGAVLTAVVAVAEVVAVVLALRMVADIGGAHRRALGF